MGKNRFTILAESPSRRKRSQHLGREADISVIWGRPLLTFASLIENESSPRGVFESNINHDVLGGEKELELKTFSCISIFG